MIHPINLDDVSRKNQYLTKLKKEIEDFLATNEKAGEVELGERKASNVAASLKTYSNRYRYPIQIKQSQSRVFVIRTDI